MADANITVNFNVDLTLDRDKQNRQAKRQQQGEQEQDKKVEKKAQKDIRRAAKQRKTGGGSEFVPLGERGRLGGANALRKAEEKPGYVSFKKDTSPELIGVYYYTTDYEAKADGNAQINYYIAPVSNFQGWEKFSQDVPVTNFSSNSPIPDTTNLLEITTNDFAAKRQLIEDEVIIPFWEETAGETIVPWEKSAYFNPADPWRVPQASGEDVILDPDDYLASVDIGGWFCTSGLYASDGTSLSTFVLGGLPPPENGYFSYGGLLPYTALSTDVFTLYGDGVDASSSVTRIFAVAGNKIQIAYSAVTGGASYEDWYRCYYCWKAKLLSEAPLPAGSIKFTATQTFNNYIEFPLRYAEGGARFEPGNGSWVSSSSDGNLTRHNGKALSISPTWDPDKYSIDKLQYASNVFLTPIFKRTYDVSINNRTSPAQSVNASYPSTAQCPFNGPPSDPADYDTGQSIAKNMAVRGFVSPAEYCDFEPAGGLGALHTIQPPYPASTSGAFAPLRKEYQQSVDSENTGEPVSVIDIIKGNGTIVNQPVEGFSGVNGIAVNDINYEITSDPEFTPTSGFDTFQIGQTLRLPYGVVTPYWLTTLEFNKSFEPPLGYWQVSDSSPHLGVEQTGTQTQLMQDIHALRAAYEFVNPVTGRVSRTVPGGGPLTTPPTEFGTFSLLLVWDWDQPEKARA